MAARKKIEKEIDAAPDVTPDAMREDFIATFNKKMKGRGHISLASDVESPYMYKRIPTGILSLDVALGGGFPCGGLSQIAGPKNSCKSYLYWQMIRQLQECITFDDTRVLLAMTEMRADKQQGRLAGVKVALSNWDIEQIQKARARNNAEPLSKEEIKDLRTEVGKIDEIHAESGEVLYDGILQAVESRAYHLVVIDSLGSVMTMAEAENESLTKKTYGGSAKINTEFLRKLNALQNIPVPGKHQRDTCVIAINQVRANIGDPYHELKFPGGHALEHAQMINLSVASGSPTYESKEETTIITWDETKKKAIQTGKEVNWKIEKGKAGIHEGAKGLFVYDFRINQANFYLDAMSAGVNYGVIQQAGSWYTVNGDNGEPLLKAFGKAAFLEALANDVRDKGEAGDMNTILNLIRYRVFKTAGLDINYDWE